MKTLSDKTDSTSPENYLLATLLDFFRNPEASVNFHHAAKIALNILSRDIQKSSLLEKRYSFYAGKLNNNISSESLRAFALACCEAAKKHNGSKAVVPALQAPTMQTLRRRAKIDLAQSIRLGHSENAAVNRAAYELMKSRKAELAEQRRMDAFKTHPLRETLEGLMVDERYLAKEDIRSHLLRLKRNTPIEKPFNSPASSGKAVRNEGILFNLLSKAKAFSASRLHRLLGDELFFLCRPSGFMDQQGTIVVIEVPTSAHLHALSYRKLEILRALKHDEQFVNAKKLHFKVLTRSY